MGRTGLELIASCIKGNKLRVIDNSRLVQDAQVSCRDFCRGMTDGGYFFCTIASENYKHEDDLRTPPRSVYVLEELMAGNNCYALFWCMEGNLTEKLKLVAEPSDRKHDGE